VTVIPAHLYEVYEIVCYHEWGSWDLKCWETVPWDTRSTWRTLVLVKQVCCFCGKETGLCKCSFSQSTCQAASHRLPGGEVDLLGSRLVWWDVVTLNASLGGVCGLNGVDTYAVVPAYATLCSVTSVLVSGEWLIACLRCFTADERPSCPWNLPCSGLLRGVRWFR
jgi:hypothetical protein